MIALTLALFYLSGAAALSHVNVEVDSGGELVSPPLLTVDDVSLTMGGTLTGVDHMALGDGATVSLEASGSTNGESTGEYKLTTLTVDGRTSDGAASATC